MERKQIVLSVTEGYRTALMDGCLVPDSPLHMATELFYPISKGDYIECVDPDYVFAVATFSAKREEKYLYTYDYKTDSAWVTYRQDLTPDSYSQETYVFEEDGYCRICVKRADGQPVTGEDAEKIKDILHFYVSEKEYVSKECFVEEIEDTAKKVGEIWDDGMLTLCLLTDSHYTVNGTWEDTVDNIKKTFSALRQKNLTGQDNEADEDAADMESVAVDSIVHLGDFTDGMTSKKVTSYYVCKMLEDLQQNQVPVYITPGNHDSNYFRGNKQRFSMDEQKELFGMEQECYYRDFQKQKIRCLFLTSYDANVPVRYGFSDEAVEWVRDTLDKTPAGYKVLVFSHEAPLDILDYWARIICNGRNLMNVLEEYNAKGDRQVLAFIHGHTHAEYVYEGSSFPIISIGCNKCEYYPDKKPAGSHAYMREPGTVTQDLWDMLLVDSEGESLHFVRFGAGEDRVVDCHKKKSTWRQAAEEKRKSRTTRIWAHRGSSGFAPENTMPSFEIAKELGVDGIELDVQMTKDGELVVIHDETIDRVSDGKGWVKNYTLAELRRFNFAKNKPGFGFVTIPTLREVYELFQDTDYVINVELKTGVVAYDGSEVTVAGAGRETTDRRCLEEKVHELTEEMGMTKQVIYSSFNHASIMKIRQYVTDEQTAFLFRDGWLDVARYGEKHGVQALHPAIYYQNLPKLVEQCHAKGMKVHVWTVNEEAQALQLRAAGVDAIITNHPGKMREAFLH